MLHLQKTSNNYHHYNNFDDHYGSGGWEDYVDYDEYGSGYDDYSEGSAGIIIISSYCPHWQTSSL